MGATGHTPPTTLRPALRTRDVWALGVGIVVCGQYFGWNLALERAGPVASLVASLLVCLLFLAWVLLLAELAVFWAVGGTNFSWDRFWTPRLRADGAWGEIAYALPFALWWLIIIEGAALAAGEALHASRAVPRGLTLAVLTVVVLVVLTTL